MNKTAKKFSVVSNDLPDPPYEHTMSNGYSFDLNVARMQNSDSWVLCSPDLRPWMMMTWVISWVQNPCGTLPCDDELIAARIGCSIEFLQVHRRFILRGWEKHSDGRLYHHVVTEEVLKMIEKREKWKNKKKSQRIDSKGKIVHEGTSEMDYASRQNKNVISLESSDSVACPHKEIIALYHEMMPELPVIVLSRWPDSKDASALKARWNEDKRHQSLDFWERFFHAVRNNNFWMGQNERGWKANLRWLVKRENFDKVIERMVDTANREAAHG